MSKKIKIPDWPKPFAVSINDKEYIYEPGTEVDVPDEVATIIEQAVAANETPVPEVEPPFGGASSWGDLPGEIPKEKLPEALQFGKETEMVEHTFQPTNWQDNVTNLDGLELVEGRTYWASFDGVEYEGVATANDSNVVVTFVEDNEQQIAIQYENAGCWLAYDDGEGKPSTVIIRYEETTITPIAEEYMPLLTSPNGTQYKLTVTDDGTLVPTAV